MIYYFIVTAQGKGQIKREEHLACGKNYMQALNVILKLCRKYRKWYNWEILNIRLCGKYNKIEYKEGEKQ